MPTKTPKTPLVERLSEAKEEAEAERKQIAPDGPVQVSSRSLCGGKGLRRKRGQGEDDVKFAVGSFAPRGVLCFEACASCFSGGQRLRAAG